jgi:type II secretory pathway pseudopilin PulG
MAQRLSPRRMRALAYRRDARGMTLVMTLIFIAIFLMMAISLIGSSLTSTRVAGNQQMTLEARTMAQQEIERVISTDFTQQPTLAAATRDVDVNGDGKRDYVVTMSPPTCVSSTPVYSANKVVDYSNEQSLEALAQVALGSNAQTTGVFSGSNANPNVALRYANHWDVQATVSGGAEVELHQGIAVEVPLGTACPS